jgi:hypothetical protein
MQIQALADRFDIEDGKAGLKNGAVPDSDKYQKHRKSEQNCDCECDHRTPPGSKPSTPDPSGSVAAHNSRHALSASSA